jgi:hypothetical protein
MKKPQRRREKGGLLTLLLSSLPLWFLLHCGPHTAVHPTPLPADAWSKLSYEERHSVMTFTVLPNMARTWREFKKTRAPEMTCRTCHGKDAEAVSYKMPNPSLPPIDPNHPPAGPVAAFMRDTVVPNMIELIETTPEHFGCNACHPRGKP